MDEFLLVRKVGKPTEILVPGPNGRMMKSLKADSKAIVVTVGRGRYNQFTGKIDPIDPEIRVGCTIVAQSQHFLTSAQFPDIKELEDEGLALIPASMVALVERP